MHFAVVEVCIYKASNVFSCLSLSICFSCFCKETPYAKLICFCFLYRASIDRDQKEKSFHLLEKKEPQLPFYYVDMTKLSDILDKSFFIAVHTFIIVYLQ